MLGEGKRNERNETKAYFPGKWGKVGNPSMIVGVLLSEENTFGSRLKRGSPVRNVRTLFTWGEWTYGKVDFLHGENKVPRLSQSCSSN